MGISVQVRTFTREVVASCTHPAISALCDRAASRNLPLLGWVDPYDDTVFNRSQLKALVPELQQLAADSTTEEAEAADEILALATHVEREPHQYLVFNGD